MAFVGIDPGKEGGIAVLDRDGAWGMPMPLLGKEIDVVEIADILQGIELSGSMEMVVIERIGNRPGQSAQSGITSGTNYGMLLGLVISHRYPLRIVTPQTWKAKVLKGTPKDKGAAIAFSARAYPTVDLKPGKKRTPHDGIADAVCLADYGRQLMTPEVA